MLSIRRFLLRDILALMALVMLGLTGLSWFAGWEILRHQASNRLEEAVRGLARNVEEHEAVGVRCAANLQGLFLSASHASPEVLDHALIAQLMSFPEIHGARLFTPDGVVQSWQAPIGAARLAWSAHTSNRADLQPAERDVMERTRAQKRPAWSHGLPGRRDPAIWGSYLVPIHARQTFLGVLSMDMAASSLTESLQKRAPHPAMGLFFLASDGLPLLPLDRDPALQPLLPAVRDLLSGQSQGPQVAKVDGKRHLLAHIHFPGKGWRFAVSMPLREFDREYRHFRILLLSLCAVFFAVLAWRTVLLARRFRTPLRQLADLARTLEAGQVPPPIDTDIREVRRLSEAFTRAAETIHRQLQFERNAASGQRLELMGSLAGGIAHDVNNHLTAIMGQMGLARDGLPREHPSFPRLERAEEAALRCSDMIRALLNFSGRTPSDMESLDLNLVVARSAELFERLLGGRIRLELRLHPALPRIRGSRVNLEQVLMNLAVNARDAMPEGGTLRIETGLVAPQDVRLTISDTGWGIPRDHLPHIFEPFFTTKTPDKGSGLGLAMVRSIVQEQGGTIAVDTEEGHGTSFTLQFPAGPELPVSPPRTAPPAATPPNLEGRRILVVEDEPNLRELLSETFLKSRALVASAPDGAIAWHMLQESDFDLVFTDQRMPEMTGLQLIERIRSRKPELPVILASGFHLEGPELEHIGRDPYLRFLAKPFMLPAVLNLVASMLRTADLSGRTLPPGSPA